MARSIEGVAQFESKHSVGDTVHRVQQLLQENGIKLFSLIDHSGEAESVGLHLRPTKLLIFGSPKAGTPLMQAAPTAAIDLPLKALVWQDDSGKVWLGWNTPEFLQHRHGFSEELIKNIAGVSNLLQKAAE